MNGSGLWGRTERRCRCFFDTTISIAASEQSHPYHARALPALRVVAGHDVGFINAHSIAETYAALTRLPVQPRIHPSEAARIITDNIVSYCTVVPFAPEAYLQALAVVRDAGFLGRRFMMPCSWPVRRSGSTPFNLSDFRQLATPDQRSKVMAPKSVQGRFTILVSFVHLIQNGLWRCYDALCLRE